MQPEREIEILRATIKKLETERDMAAQNATMQAEQYEALGREKDALQKDVDFYIKKCNEKSEQIHALERELTALRMGRESYTKRIL